MFSDPLDVPVCLAMVEDLMILENLLSMFLSRFLSLPPHQLADTNALGSLKDLLESAQGVDKRVQELLGWLLSTKAWSIHSTRKQEVRTNTINSSV